MFDQDKAAMSEGNGGKETETAREARPPRPPRRDQSPSRGFKGAAEG